MAVNENQEFRIRKVLVANRGEIAFRIMKTLRKMDISSVAIYSDIDQGEPYVSFADESYGLAGNNTSETYLNIEKIIAVAQKAQVDAIHPGYGFLSENPHLAQACLHHGIIFIGPSPEVIQVMGDKILSKEIVEKHGIPTLKAYPCESMSFDDMCDMADTLGYPVVIKAAAGGGGKGMRMAASKKDLRDALSTAQSEALNYFADDRVYMEKYIESPRHIEVQILADQHGHCVHLWERECSIQRRHQKVIEEAPASVLSHDLRSKITQSAVTIAQSVHYCNAGTVEFLLDQHGNFYFLEMNTRLQVEHPVTEMITGIDIVQKQVEIAQNKPLNLTQENIYSCGHAIEARIYAENPAKRFMPDIGKVEVLKLPNIPYVRLEIGVREGSSISVFYDPMIAKVIACGSTRHDAIKTLSIALQNFILLGVVTNIDFLQDILSHPDFVQGHVNTTFLEQDSFYRWGEGRHIPDEVYIIAAKSFYHTQQNTKVLETVVEQSRNPWYMIHKGEIQG